MNPSETAADKREIRVFISSTFRDMMRERDHSNAEWQMWIAEFGP